ncbi:MAG: hypothetical protein JWM25_1000 [Thermoleophilia bacterium]|nr:hypothetical protein [Thermoleophilia bacterium]
MSINALNQSAALPNAVQLASGPMGGMPVAGMTMEKPSLGARLVNAVKAAISELRGVSPSAAQLGAQQLGASAGLPSGMGMPTAEALATPVKKTVSAKGMTLAQRKAVMERVAKEQEAGVVAAPAAAAGAVGTQLPAHATQLPGATVYSYDGNGNPAVAGLQGLSPQMQSQLGMSPTMLGNVNGLVNSVDPTPVPQTNATNQNNIGAAGMMGASASPVLGAPVLQPAAAGTNPAGAATQSVTNTNSSDRSSLNQDPYGSFGGTGYGTYGSATAAQPYGSSMTGAYTQGGIGGFFSRLLG